MASDSDIGDDGGGDGGGGDDGGGGEDGWKCTYNKWVVRALRAALPL